MKEKKHTKRKLKKHVTVILGNISMSLIGLRKAVQAAIGVVSDTVFNNNNPYLSYNPRVMTALQVLLPIQMVIYAGYTLISTIAAFIRLNDIWNDEGRYKHKPASTFKKAKTSIFSGAMALSDFSVFLLTILVVVNVTALTGTAGITMLLINGAINVTKYGFKLMRLAQLALKGKIEEPKLKYSLSSTAIKFGLACLMMGAMLSIFLVPSPINLIIPGVLLLTWAVGRLLHTNVFQPKLKAHFIDNQSQDTNKSKHTKTPNNTPSLRRSAQNFKTTDVKPERFRPNRLTSINELAGDTHTHPANLYSHSSISTARDILTAQPGKPRYNPTSAKKSSQNHVTKR